MKLRIPKTYLPKTKDIKRKEHVINADGISLGRVATQAAMILMGKHRKDYTPHIDVGDFVVVTNAVNVKITGNKLEDKEYHYFTGYVGNFKTTSLKERMKKEPTKVIFDAVYGMVPNNRLRAKRLKRLIIFTQEQTKKSKHG